MITDVRASQMFLLLHEVNCFSGNETIGVWIKGRSPRLIMVEWAAVIEGSSLFVGVGPAIA